MAIESAGLNEAVNDAVADTITLRLHTGNPGSSGASNLITTSTLSRPTIAGNSGWSVSGASAMPASDPSFGTAGASISGISWISLFKGSIFWARRQLTSSVTVTSGDTVTLDASTLTITATSTD